MSDFDTAIKTRKARKKHRCTYCGESICKGESYRYHKGRFDDCWYESKLHWECEQVLKDSGVDEYTPFINDRPKALIFD